MLEWTGERFLPWIKDSTIAYEHLHRYAYAAQFTRGKRVLDLASGEGYGSNLLAGTAAFVIGIDIDIDAVRHASTKYATNNLKFIEGAITKVPITEDQSFDLIVCFEAIEHIEDHDMLMAEVKRLLKPDGLFIVSTPNKAVYDRESPEENPYHVRELSIDEFQQLLGRYFKHARYYGQRVLSNSNLWAMDDRDEVRIQELVIARGETEFEFIAGDKRTPLYVIALASDASIAVPDAGSVLVDDSNELQKEKDRWYRQQIDQRETAIAWLQTQIADKTEGLEWREKQVAEMQRSIDSQEEALAWRTGQVESLERDNATLVDRLHAAQHQLGITTGQLEAIHASAGWKFILRSRHLRDRVMPEGSLQRRLFERFRKAAR